MKRFTTITTLLLGGLASLITQAGTLDPALEAAIADMHPGDDVKVIVHCLDPLDPTQVAPEDLVVSLKNKADSCVTSLGNSVKDATALITANAVAVTVPVSRLNGLKNKAGVDRITLNQTVKLPPQPQLAGLPGDPPLTYWNISETRAPDLWALGSYGTGLVVATMDTGVDANHADIGPAWRGGSNSWYDPSGQHATPFDSNGHGTGVMGLVVGGNTGGIDLGMAPDAQWIAVKLFDDSDETDFAKIHQSFDWLLDPNGDLNPSDAPDIVNNSWVLQGTEDQCLGEFAADITVLKAAGIAVVFSGGNYGPNANTSMDPANNTGSLSVGAIDYLLNVHNLSSRGPSALGQDCDGGTYPHVVAPGKDVLTAGLTLGGAYPNQYTYGSGTSYAAPHVAGAMALLMSAVPSASVAEIEAAIKDTAFDLGDPGADNVSGAGLVDVVEAFYMLDGSTPPSDEDLDGVPDTPDLCPGTPEGEAVDADGCSASQLDGDGDGVSDAVDQCPDTPAGETVNADGCSDSQLDSDNDGISDAADLCPATPAGETVNANGCSDSQLDSDNDGVSNALDQCPDTPAGEIVDADGCPVGAPDTDGDGVSDAIDQCPATPTGESVDVNGCSASQRDSDNDGVSDAVDLCPATPAGTAVDGDGCPLPVGPVDADGDGVTEDLDCNDNDASVYPGATEVKHDGVDQDCNGYDLTIDITKFTYRASDERVLVYATSALDGGAALKITFEGPGGETLTRNMTWKASKDRWQKGIKGFAGKFGFVPVSVTVSGPEGSETATL